MSLPGDNEIIGVGCKKLLTHQDERGFFREVIRSTDDFFDTDGFKQWSHSFMKKNVVKAWHYHHVQTDWWYVPIGQIEVVLFDNREESKTYKKKLVFKIGESSYLNDTHEACVKIPPGVLHGLKVLSESAHLFYITSKTYDPKEEGRFKFNSSLVEHDWGSNVLVAPNDTKDFIPTSTRQKII